MDPNAKLSPHFTYGEFKCECGCHPSPEVLNRMKAVAEALEHVREALGQPIDVKSGYRCPAHNAATPKAAPKSRHIQGDAADFQVVGWSGKQLKVVVELLIKSGKIHDGGIGTYPDRPATCHIDLRPDHTRWDK